MRSVLPSSDIVKQAVYKVIPKSKNRDENCIRHSLLTLKQPKTIKHPYNEASEANSIQNFARSSSAIMI